MSDGTAPTVPPFCPRPTCSSHADGAPPWRWQRAGFYSRQAAPRRIQRYRCVDCGHDFSDQTFSTTYWLKRPSLLLPVFEAQSHCTGFRQLARSLRCSPQTVMAMVRRLGRHCQLFHELHRPRGPLEEPLCLDGLRNFEYSQYHPSEFHLAIGRHSHFIHGFTHSELRRMGTMTARQRRRRERLEREHGRPDPRSVEHEVARLLAIVTAGSTRLVIHTDENPAYPRALGRLGHLQHIEHHTISSRAVRDTENPLFASNLADGLSRHSMANHKRETIAFSKTIASAIARMWVFVVWRNYHKWFSERRRGGTPAMRVGACEHRWGMARILSRRLFPARIKLPKGWQDHYRGTVPTRQVPNQRIHDLRYAF